METNVTWTRFEDDPNLVDSSFALGRGNDGRYVVAWGRNAGRDALSDSDVEDGECGHAWHDTQEGANRYLESILETARS